MAQVSAGVRPTKRCLADLDLSLPDLGHPLDEIDHPVVAIAQAIPKQRDAGGAQRILSLSDRVWFKVKTGEQRAVATELRGGELPDGLPSGLGAWWIGAAGRRQADSPQRDFYESIQRECTFGRTVSSARLLPDEWDWKRLSAEQAIAWRREMKRIVIRLISMSLTTGAHETDGMDCYDIWEVASNWLPNLHTQRSAHPRGHTGSPPSRMGGFPTLSRGVLPHVRCPTGAHP